MKNLSFLMLIEAALLPRNLSSHLLLFHFITVPLAVPPGQKVAVPTVPVTVPQLSFPRFLYFCSPIFVLEPNENCIPIRSISNLVVLVFQICTGTCDTFCQGFELKWTGRTRLLFFGILLPSTKARTINKELSF